MKLFFRWFVTGFGIGYSPFAPGTAGSFLGLILFLPIQSISIAYAIPFLFLLSGLGVYAANIALPLFFKSKDPSEIVIDEIVAILFVLFMIPTSPVWWGAGFLLFRFFDIKKPFGIRQFEKLPGGWGIMADDLIAALYTILILQSVNLLTHFNSQGSYPL